MKPPHAHFEALLLLPPPLPNHNPNIPLHQTNSEYGGVFSSRAELCNDSPRQPVENWRAESTGGKKENTGRTVGKQWKRLIPPPRPPSFHANPPPTLHATPHPHNARAVRRHFLSCQSAAPSRCLIESDCIITGWEWSQLLAGRGFRVPVVVVVVAQMTFFFLSN